MNYKITTTSGKDYMYNSDQSEKDLIMDIDIKNYITNQDGITIFTRHIESVRVK